MKKLFTKVLIGLLIILCIISYNLHNKYQTKQNELSELRYMTISNAFGYFSFFEKKFIYFTENNHDSSYTNNDAIRLNLNLRYLNLAKNNLNKYSLISDSWDNKKYNAFIEAYKSVLNLWINNILSEKNQPTKEQFIEFENDLQYVLNTLLKVEWTRKKEGELTDIDFFYLENYSYNEVEEIIEDIIINAKSEYLKKAFEEYSEEMDIKVN